MNSRPGEGQRTKIVLAVTLVAMGAMFPLWVVDFVATHDGPQHIFGAYLHNHLLDPGTGYAAFFRSNTPVTGLGFPALFATLEAVVPWRLALTLSLSAITLIWASGCFQLCRAMHPERWLSGLLGFVCAFQWAFYMGLFSFVLSCGIGFHLLAYATQHRSWSLRQHLFLATLLTLQSVVHVFGAAASGLVLGLLIVIRTPFERLLRELGALLLISVPTLVIASLATGEAAAGGVASSGDGLTMLERLQTPAALFFAGPWWRRWPLLALTLAGLVSAFARIQGQTATKEEVTLAVVATLFLAVGVVAPINVPGWDYLSPRFLPYGIVCALALLPSERLSDLSPPRRLGFGILAIVLLSANLGWATVYHVDLAARTDDALTASQAPIRRSGPRLPIILNPNAGLLATSLAAPVPFALPLRNVDKIFALNQGGYVPYFFANNPTLHPVLLTDDAKKKLPASPNRGYITPLFQGPAPSAEERAVIVNYLLSFAPNYSDVIFSGTERDITLMRQRGFAFDFEKGSVVISRFEGCPTSLQVNRPQSAALLVEMGWFPSMETSFHTALPPSDGAATVPLTGAPCGTLWLRVVLDRDASGALSPDDLTCRDAAPDGIFLVERTPGHATVECAWRAGF